jgi:hypothetical protein
VLLISEELQRVCNCPIELGLSLRQAELDVAHAAIAQDCDQNGDVSLRAANPNAAAGSPVNLHGLTGFVLHGLVDTRWTSPNPANTLPYDCDSALIAIGASSNFFVNP